MAELRPQVFLATKTGLRDRDAAWAQVNASLERLRTDHVDLLQLHAIGDLDELDRATRPGGALEAAVRAQEEGLVGAVGITGHGPQAAATHLEALRRFPFATVLTPLNAVLWRDERFRDDWAALVDEVPPPGRRADDDQGGVAPQLAGRRRGRAGRRRDYATWYEPLVDPEQIRAAVSWVLAHEEVTGLATAGDVRLLRHLVAAERDRMDVLDAEAVLDGVRGLLVAVRDDALLALTRSRRGPPCTCSSASP